MQHMAELPAHYGVPLDRQSVSDVPEHTCSIVCECSQNCNCHRLRNSFDSYIQRKMRMLNAMMMMVMMIPVFEEKEVIFQL